MLRRDLDTAERHAIVARLVGSARDVLDVGGLPGRLGGALPGAEVTTVNVGPPADVLFDGDRLPFTDRAFEVVTSLDVLEHLDPAARSGHLSEVVRVAARRAVLCCPLGTPEHVAAERALAEWYAEVGGERDPFLDDHVAKGLPTEHELRRLLAGAGGEAAGVLSFHGDFRVAGDLFRLRALAHFRRRPADRLRYAWRRLTVRRDESLGSIAGPHVNRAFLVLDRAGGAAGGAEAASG